MTFPLFSHLISSSILAKPSIIFRAARIMGNGGRVINWTLHSVDNQFKIKFPLFNDDIERFNDFLTANEVGYFFVVLSKFMAYVKLNFQGQALEVCDVKTVSYHGDPQYDIHPNSVELRTTSATTIKRAAAALLTVFAIADLKDKLGPIDCEYIFLLFFCLSYYNCSNSGCIHVILIAKPKKFGESTYIRFGDQSHKAGFYFIKFDKAVARQEMVITQLRITGDCESLTAYFSPLLFLISSIVSTPLIFLGSKGVPKIELLDASWIDKVPDNEKTLNLAGYNVNALTELRNKISVVSFRVYVLEYRLSCRVYTFLSHRSPDFYLPSTINFTNSEGDSQNTPLTR